ncbi:transcriptional regulator PtsJ [Acidovorax sp. SDU_ACID1]|uniref:MocR-like B6 salvage transcription factor PtsJ n=1 Tax=Acidovorax sp. SDU_ACID1 TaxID=3136632 RepID=UPI003873BB3F
MRIVGKTSAEIFDSIRSLTQTGALVPGQALPTVRELAAKLGVNRNTVSMAYRRLVNGGIAVTQGRLGTVIRGLPGAGEQEGVAPGSPLIDLGSGNPNPNLLPDIRTALVRRPYRPRLYGESPVDPDLEDMVRPWLGRDCPTPFEINLTHGSVDAVERLLSAYLVAGDKVAVEDPCFISSVNTLRTAGLQAIGVAVDQQGMSADALACALAQGAKAVIVTPRAHNPTGCSLDSERAHALRSVLACYPHVLVIVDDHFSLLAESSYHDVIPPMVGHWALVRSVSKTLGPDLRVAFVASDRETSRHLRLHLARGTNWVSHVLQDIVLACMTRPQARDRMKEARVSYARCRSVMAKALAGQGLNVWDPADGLNLWLPLRGASASAASALARHGWMVRGGEIFGVQTSSHGLRITISTLDEGAAHAFALDLRHVLEPT